MKNLIGFFKDDEGNLSSLRLVLLLWSSGLLIAWLIACIASGALVAIPSTVVTFMGILIGGKVGQKFGEDKNKTNQGDGPSTPQSNGNSLTDSLLPSLTATTLGGETRH